MFGGVPAKNNLNPLLKERSLVQQQLDSFNYFVMTEIKNIVHANNVITSEHDPDFSLRYEKVYIGSPSVIDDGVTIILTPQDCRLSDMTYAAPIFVDVRFTRRRIGGEIETQFKKRVDIGRMPIMLKSCCCVLHKENRMKLARYGGECQLDPGGYFVIKGKEKVILIQEQRAKNNIIIDTDEKGCVQGSVDCCTNSIMSKTIIKMKKKKMYLYLNQFTSKVPIMVVLKAMGMESHQEVIRMIGDDPQYIALMCPSFEDCMVEDVHTQKDAVEFLGKKVKELPHPNASQEEEALIILRNTFIAHIPVQGNNFFPKCVYVALMLRQMMDVLINKENVNDKDYVGNKRLELSGQLLSLLFEDLFKKMNDEARKSMDKSLRKLPWNSFFNTLAHLMRQQSIITSGLERTLLTGDFGVRRFRRHLKGMTQNLTRMSYIASLGHMTKISPQFEISRKSSGHRALQPSQWGMFCPCDTPVGEACGLVKHLALMTHVTTDVDEDSLSRLCCTHGVEDLNLTCTEELHMSNSYFVILNGKILGKHTMPQVFANTMRSMRRAGEISKFVSIFVNDKQRCVYIASDGGRVCRPLIIADKVVLRSEEKKMKIPIDEAETAFEKALKSGRIEYLDVNEENNALIALFEENAKEGTTHIEIEPFTILGVTAGLIPYPHHNQSPRNAYACAMAKQAMGNIADNQLTRVDSLINLLVYPQKPLLTTRTSELVHFDKLGAGQNATVAVMSYSGYDINDAIVMNRASLDHGFGRCIVMKKLSAVCQTYANRMSDNIIKPDREGYEAEKMQILDDDGVAAPGEIIRPNDIYIAKQSPIVICSTGQNPGTGTGTGTDSQYKSSKQRYKGPEGETAAVDRVALYSDEKNNLCFKFMIRNTRRPEVGDKFSSRHGQKGVCGTIVPQEDLPFSECGICPDLIINPHVFPSRMTFGEMIELLGSKASALDYRIRYGSAFGEPSGNTDKVEDISKTLVKHGFSYDGKRLIVLRHHWRATASIYFRGSIILPKVETYDKMHARDSGLREINTRQPTEGQWVGERDRDCLIAYGGSMLLYERLMLSSDPFEVQVCRKCGLLGYYNFKLKLGICSTCKNGKSMCAMKLPYACKLLIQELQSMNIVPRLKLTEA